jgi:hypothetical protein
LLLNISLIAGAVSLIILFLVANRGAYRGFFSEDDFDNIANARAADFGYYVQRLIKPTSTDTVFRPVPSLYYYVMARAWPLRFGSYLFVIQMIHLLNVFLVWLIARTLGAARLGAFAAAVLFAFHAAMMTIYWRPMYVFDLICATFTLLTVLTYLRGPLFLSLVFFWLALQSKEVTVFLPLALLAYEWFFQKRRWKRVEPFLAISAFFGIWALVYNTHRDDAYSLRFTVSAVRECAQFYAAKLILGPARVGMLVLAIAALFARNRVVRLGLVTFVALMLVLLVLPGRTSGAYLYTASIGLAMAISTVTRPVWLAVFFAFWIPWNYRQLRIDRNSELSAADERRLWFTPVADFVKTHPDVDAFVYQNHPATLGSYGVSGALTVLHPVESKLLIADAESADQNAALSRPGCALLLWDPYRRIMHIMQREPDAAYIALTYVTPPWQLTEGWIGIDYSFRWIGPHAVARLARPPGTRTFEIAAFVPNEYLKIFAQRRLTVSLNHKPVGTAVFDKFAPETFRFALAPEQAGPVEVELDVSPPTPDPAGPRGLPVVGFGFKP